MYQTISDLNLSGRKNLQDEHTVTKLATNDMYPDLWRGDIVKLRKISFTSFIQWGRIYMVHLKGYGELLRKVMPGDVEGYIKLVSGNENDLPTIEMSINEVYEMKIVVASIRNY